MVILALGNLRQKQECSELKARVGCVVRSLVLKGVSGNFAFLQSCSIGITMLYILLETFPRISRKGDLPVTGHHYIIVVVNFLSGKNKP